MEDAHSLYFIREILIILAISGLVVPLLHRVKISPVLGFLLSGALIGPFGLALFADQAPILSYIAITDAGWVQLLAEFGVMLLLFMIGLELSISWLCEMRRMVLGLGSLQIIICSAVIGATAYYFGNGVQASVLLGASLALSSTATVVELLKEHHLLNRKVGTTSFAILLMQDLAVVPIIILLTMFASEVEGGSNIVSMVAFALFKAAAAIGIIYFIGRRIIRPLFQYVGCERSTEWFMPLILLVIVGAAAITYASGLSLALGAFLAGLLINETEYRHEVELVVEPLKGIFMGIFFLSVGMMIDVREIARVPFWVFFSVLGIFTIKGTVIFILGVLAKMPASRAIHVALLLGQSGEFAFLIVGLSMQHGLLNAEGGQFFLIVTAISMFITPFVAYGAGKLARWLEQKEDCNSTWVSEHGSGHEKGHVIIVGFGRVGKKVGDILEEEKIPYVAIDKSSGHLSRLRNQGYPLYFGDARKFHLLKRLNAEDARAIVITSDDFASTQTILENVRRIAPLLPTIVRARDDVHVQQLFAAGANFVIPEALETSLQIAKDVLSEIGIDPSEIRDVLEKSRKVEEVG